MAVAATKSVPRHLVCMSLLVSHRWLEDIRDWCVSRQLWWGHRIPAFYAVLDGEAGTPGSLDERLDQWLVAADREAAEQLAQEKFPGRSFTLHQARACAGSLPHELVSAARLLCANLGRATCVSLRTAADGACCRPSHRALL